MVSIRRRLRSVAPTAAKLDAAIFWKIVITNPSARPLLARLRGKVVSVSKILRQIIVEAPLSGRQSKGMRVNLPSTKQRLAIRIARVSLRSPKDNGVETVTVLQHIAGVLKQARIEKPDKHPEAEVISLVWCCSQEQQVPAMLTERLTELEVLRLPHPVAILGRSKVVSLVEHDQVPGRCLEETPRAGWPLESVDASYETVVLYEGVAAPVGDIPLGSRTPRNRD